MQNNNQRVLVIGATGTVGGEALRALRTAGAEVRALVRNPQAARELRGVEVVTGDLRDRDTVRAALVGVQSAFYVSPHESDEEQLAELFISECEHAAVRLVFVGVHVTGPNRFVRALRRWIFGFMFKHYRPKFRIAERARASKTSPVVLMPTNYYQNDDVFRSQIVDGVYSQPFVRPVNRVDARDIGAAAARACLDRDLPSGAYPVVGPESLDAAACAQAWSAALGRQICVADPDGPAFDDMLEKTVTAPKKLGDFRASYMLLRSLTVPTNPAEVAQTTALLGRPPISYAQYVGDVARSLDAATAAPNGGQGERAA